MARPKSFNEDKVLDAATACFRRQGLNAASIRDLSEEMGIAGPSLYNAFGCKRGLFIQALDRYVDCGMRSRFVELEACGPKAAIFAFTEEFVERARGAADQGRCLLVNSAMEVDPEDAELAGRVAAYLGEIETFLCLNLTRAQAAGEIAPELNAEEAARMLLGILLGISVLARLRPDAPGLEQMLSPALALLETPSNHEPRS